MEDLSILIVDDEPFNLLVLENLLYEFKIVKIYKAFNGLQALELVKETPTGFDIVFTDNQMPEMLGVEFAR